MNPPIPWEAFARLQSQSNPRTVHARSAGREEAIETVLDTDHGGAIVVPRGLHDGAYYRVESWTVTAAGQDAYAFARGCRHEWSSLLEFP